jgi:pectate lyase
MFSFLDFGLIAPPAGAQSAAIDPNLAFPDAKGWAAHTQGGRGGRIIKVTTLAADGPGSLRAAIEAKGPRIIVFEVGGVIDLGGKAIRLAEPFVTVAGQTAPSPGITLIKGAFRISGHDVVVQHIRSRLGEAGHEKASGWDEDSMRTDAAHDVIVDHCSLTWATNKNLSASGPRFSGNSPDEWRSNTSHRITFSNNIIAEGLSRSTHHKIEHSKGTLIHDNATEILLFANLYAHNYERSPLIKGGGRVAMVNNFIYNPGQRAVHYNLMPLEWGDHPYQVGQLAAVGNVLRFGPSTPDQVTFLMIGGAGDLEFFDQDNLAVDRMGAPVPMIGRYTTQAAQIKRLDQAPLWPEGLVPWPSSLVEYRVQLDVGARPWDRDYHDVRLIMDVTEGRGRIIDGERDVGGYPIQTPTRRSFDANDWDLATMMPRRPDVLDATMKAKGT